MATAFDLIEKSILLSDAANVEFSGIPSGYKDLFLVCSVRTTNSGRQDIDLLFNSDTGSNYSRAYMQGNGSSASGFSNSSATTVLRLVNIVVGDGETSNSFSTQNIYIPNYRSTTFTKPINHFGAHEVDSATAYISAHAGLWAISPEAIVTIKLTPTAGNWKTGSSFYLYGITNS